tara:strand:+ start:1168 stop:1383 length:216 start_codon:yes stop_codon:yes gene_type:complete
METLVEIARLIKKGSLDKVAKQLLNYGTITSDNDNEETNTRTTIFSFRGTVFLVKKQSGETKEVILFKPFR